MRRGTPRVQPLNPVAGRSTGTDWCRAATAESGSVFSSGASATQWRGELVQACAEKPAERCANRLPLGALSACCDGSAGSAAFFARCRIRPLSDSAWQRDAGDGAHDSQADTVPRRARTRRRGEPHAGEYQRHIPCSGRSRTGVRVPRLALPPSVPRPPLQAGRGGAGSSVPSRRGEQIVLDSRCS